MIKTLKLLIPVLIPSWNFFDVIAPSPRIEYAFLEKETSDAKSWQEFRPRPTHLPITTLVKRLLWNPHWNKSLFMVSCAERLMTEPTQHSLDEITGQIRADVLEACDIDENYLQFRLVYLSRKGSEIIREVCFLSPITPLQDAD